VCTRTRCSRRWASLTGTEVPARFRRRIRPRGTWGANGSRGTAWNHRDARDGLEPPVPVPIGASAPGCVCVSSLDVRAGGPHSPVPRFQPVLGIASAPGAPQVQMGGEGRPGTTGTGPYRCFGTGICVCARTRSSRRWTPGNFRNENSRTFFRKVPDFYFNKNEKKRLNGSKFFELVATAMADRL
jgi:hypothetical protein